MSRVIEQATVYRDGNRTTTYFSRSDGITLIEYSDKTWGVKFQGSWLPGKYISREAAICAVNCPRIALEKATHHSVRGVGLNYKPLTLEELEGMTCSSTKKSRP